MEKRYLKEKAGILIPNKNGCTNFGAVALNGKKLYCLKTAQSNTASTLYTYQDFRTGASFKTRKYTNQMGHGNGMAYWDGKIYIAPLDNYVQILDEKNGMKRTKLPAPINVSSIAHYKDDLFLAGLSLVRITDSEVKLVKRFKLVWDDPDFPIGQDIGFHKDCLYIIRSSSGKNSNVILRCPFDRKEKTLVPDLIYLSEERKGLYEFESIDFYGEKMVIGANVLGDKDGIYTATVK